MLHGAIFLATCNATMTNKKPFKLQRGCHTFAFATCNAYNNKQDGGRHLEIFRERKMSSDWPILTKLRCRLQRGCYTQGTCLATLRKVEGRSTFLATRNATIAVAKWIVTRDFYFLATCNATFVTLQVATWRVTWPLIWDFLHKSLDIFREVLICHQLFCSSKLYSDSWTTCGLVRKRKRYTLVVKMNETYVPYSNLVPRDFPTLSNFNWKIPGQHLK